ncbi:MAG: hypothetical protein ACKPCM_19890, partial [Pseudanabaena sp.]
GSNLGYVSRSDGLPDTGGNLPSPPVDNPRNNYPPAYPPASEWPYGDIPVKVGGNASKILDEQAKAANANKPPNIEQKPNQSPDNLGQKTNNPPVTKSPTGFSAVPSVSNPQNKQQSSSQSSNSGFGSIPANQSPATQIYANGMTNEDYNRANVQPFPVVKQQDAPLYQSGSQVKPNQTPTVEPKIQNTTPTTPAPDPLGILSGLAGIAGAIAALKIGSDFLVNKSLEIKNQTSPENLRDAAQKGSCDTLNSPSCTANLKNDIKTPILDKVNENGGLLAAINTALSSFIAATTGNFAKILSFLDNTIVDRAIGAANFAMNVHNALMLSNALGKTLAGVVDTALNIAGFQFTNTNGQKTTASSAFTSNVSALIVNLIGQDLYTELTDDWKVANRIYQSSTNLLNKTERLLGQQSKVAQKSGIDVANIGNALRANGIVNPNSYPPMAATKEANTPPDLLTDVNTPLSSIQSGIKNLNTITKSVNGTLKQVTAIQKDFGKLQDLLNKESKVRKSLRSASAAQAKRKAKFTILQIKTIKQTGKK